MKKLKIAILPGSIREQSCNVKLGKAIIAALAKKEVETTFISLKNYSAPIYDGDLESKQGVPENIIELAKIICQHHGVILVSPEYNSSISPLLKNTLDWLSRNLGDLKAYENRVFALASCSPGSLGGIRGLMHLRDSLLNSGVEIITPQLCVGNSAKAFDENGNLTDDRHNKLLNILCQTIIKQAGYCLEESK